MITVAIIEDNRLVREGMTEMLNDLPDVEVVLAGTSLDTALLKNANLRVKYGIGSTRKDTVLAHRSTAEADGALMHLRQTAAGFRRHHHRISVDRHAQPGAPGNHGRE
jgi:chemotaxis response regulator CheB